MKGDRVSFCRRTLLVLLASGPGLTFLAGAPTQAADLVSDDGAFIRSLDIPAERVSQALPHSQHYGASNAEAVLVELFDYNCGYCRSASAPLDGILARDPHLAAQLVHFAILSPASEAAASVQQAVFLREGPERAAALHRYLMGLSGRIDGDRAHMACETLRILPPSAAQIEKARAVIVENRRSAQALGFRFTPTFALADRSFVGWPGPKTLAMMVSQARLCGRLQCD